MMHPTGRVHKLDDDAHISYHDSPPRNLKKKKKTGLNSQLLTFFVSTFIIEGFMMLIDSMPAYLSLLTDHQRRVVRRHSSDFEGA